MAKKKRRKKPTQDCSYCGQKHFSFHCPIREQHATAFATAVQGLTQDEIIKRIEVLQGLKKQEALRSTELIGARYCKSCGSKIYSKVWNSCPHCGGLIIDRQVPTITAGHQMSEANNIRRTSRWKP